MSCNIKFDLDGVIRNLFDEVRHKYGLKKPKIYNWKHKGKDIYDLAKEDNYKFLLSSDVTKYYKVIKDYIGEEVIEIWSHQPKDWRDYTSQWINKYFKSFEAHWLTPEQKYQKLQENKDMYLVEDYPFFKNYDRIILIDTSLNRNVNAKIRIKTERDLKRILENIK